MTKASQKILKAEEYFGNLLELLKDKEYKDYFVESGFIVNFKKQYAKYAY